MSSASPSRCACLLALGLGCGSDSEASPHCGDGVVHEDELCDDGNAVEGDGCNTDCRISGSLQWCYEPELPAGHSARPIAAHAFEGGVVVATTRQGEELEQRPWLLAADRAGEPVWERAIEAPPARTLALRALAPGLDGSTVLAVGLLYLEPATDVDAWIAEFDLNDGALLRERSYSDPTTSLAATSIARTDAGWVIAGWAEPHAWIAGLDGRWDIAWERRFNVDDEVALVERLVALGGGKVAAVGAFTTAELSPLDGKPWQHVFYRLYGPNGELEHELRIEEPGARHAVLDAVASDGNVLISGAETELLFGGNRLWQVSPSGAVTERWEPTNDNQAPEILAASQTGVFVGGSKGWREQGPLDAWMARLRPASTSFTWEYRGMPQGTMAALAPAVDEPALYGAISTWQLEHAATRWQVSICKLSE